MLTNILHRFWCGLFDHKGIETMTKYTGRCKACGAHVSLKPKGWK